ncbi:MAG: hypothetical protein ACK4IX_13690, partial [Candidatus Sericytochromatia bacterium]
FNHWIGISKDTMYFESNKTYINRNQIGSLVRSCQSRIKMYFTFWQMLRNEKVTRTKVFCNTGWFYEIGQVFAMYLFLIGCGTRPRSHLQITSNRLYYQVTNIETNEDNTLEDIQFTTVVRFPGDDKSRETSALRHIGYGEWITEYMVVFMVEMFDIINNIYNKDEINSERSIRSKGDVPPGKTTVIFRGTYGKPLTVDKFTDIVKRQTGALIGVYTHCRLLRFMIGAGLYKVYEGNQAMLARLFWLQNHSANTARIYYRLSNNQVEQHVGETFNVINNWIEKIDE